MKLLHIAESFAVHVQSVLSYVLQFILSLVLRNAFCLRNYEF